MARNYSDTAPQTTLVGTGGGVASGLSAADTAMELSASLSSFLTPPFALRLEPGTSQEEMVLVTAGSGTSGSPYTITRAQGTTTAKTHATGVAVAHGLYSADFSPAGVHGLATAQRVSGAPPGKTSVTAVFNNSTAETVVGVNPIGAGEALAGSAYRLTAWLVTVGATGTPTFTIRLRSGNGVSGTALTSTPITAAAGTGKVVRLVADMVQIGTPGATAQWVVLVSIISDLANAAGTFTQYFASFGASTLDSTVQRDMNFTIQWSAASASNTATLQGYYGERIY